MQSKQNIIKFKRNWLVLTILFVFVIGAIFGLFLNKFMFKNNDSTYDTSEYDKQMEFNQKMYEANDWCIQKCKSLGYESLSYHLNRCTCADKNKQIHKFTRE